ncbi:glycoside hydrolase family 88 protein [Pendulispora rubella]|uniref:Glycoside hydrolase family 88 protein n=1 Tax=Pendulispora rubella TaxID=2741070 RepID=A0ABZ2L4T8_9BACT
MSRGQSCWTGRRVSLALAMACMAMTACASETDDTTDDATDHSNIEHSGTEADAIQTTDGVSDRELVDLGLDLNVDVTLRIGNGTDVDWSVAIVESTMKRFTPSQLGGWGYTQGLYLWGQYLVYQRTHEPRYLSYIKSWADRFVDGNGHIDHSFNNLDSMESGNVLLALYAETKQVKYKTAATQIRNRLKTYPRTQDGGFWHATSTSRQHQLWSDGVFMVNPFLARYGKAIGEATYANDEVSKQLLVYANHLQVQNGLLKHAYDESRTQSWADPETGRSAEHWCRAIGWYGMATIDVLEILPPSHPNRAKLLSVLGKLVDGFKTYQDPATGRWFQVVDKGNLSDNWTETSCSAMYTYTISRAVERGYIDPSYRTVSAKGYQGVLARISNGSDGLTNVSEICIGTNVGDLAFYFARPRKTNDLHGLGAVLIMNEQLARTGG